MRETLYEVKGPKLLAEMTSLEVERLARETDIAVVPCASTEHHGPHLPLSTDAIQGTELARRLIVRLAQDNIKILACHAIPFGPDSDRMDWCGTISITNATAVALLKDICRSLYHHGFRKIALILNHYEYYPPMMTASRELVDETDAKIIVLAGWLRAGDMDSAHLISTAENLDLEGHGGELETSRILAVYPGLVHMEEAVPSLPQPHGEKIEFDTTPLRGGAVFIPPKSYKEVAPSGYVGNPRIATAEKGEKSYELGVEWLCKVIRKYFVDAVRT